MKKITNHTNVPLPAAVWLLHDDYDYNFDPMSISATSIIKPIKKIVMSARVRQNKDLVPTVDVTDYFNVSIGSSVHTAIENAWNSDKLPQILKKLGYSENTVERMIINPTTVKEGDIPIYMENRRTKRIGKYQVSGKYDFIMDGTLYDFKSASVWSGMKDTNADDFILQGSIYRWLNPDLVTEDNVHIVYIFKDWSAAKAGQDPENYPQSPIIEKQYKMLSTAATQKYLEQKIKELERSLNLPESELTPCSNDELWRDPPVWKYYKNKDKMTRSTKNFDNPGDAYARLNKDGNVGVVVEHHGKVRACLFCDGAEMCQQKNAYIAEGLLTI